jgi:hypothetical protein
VAQATDVEIVRVVLSVRGDVIVAATQTREIKLPSTSTIVHIGEGTLVVWVAIVSRESDGCDPVCTRFQDVARGFTTHTAGHI